GRVQAVGTRHERADVLHLLHLVGGDAGALRQPLPARARGEAARRAPARAAGGAGHRRAPRVAAGPRRLRGRGGRGVSTAEKYVTAAYLVVFLAVLAYVLIMSLKVGRL